MSTRPSNIGIKAIELYIPSQIVNQADLETAYGVAAGKFTIGLGQTNMSFVNDREDVYSLALTVFSKLIKSYSLDVNNIGRLEVGTETLIDKSKSVKSVLTQLLGENTDTEGIDTVNACYGGTSAVLNAVNWIESSAWDGRDAVVVAADIALYESGAARPTGGAGAVALLIGPDAPIVFDSTRGSYMSHVYDFYKPNMKQEYPVVEGHFSLSCYVRALDNAYASYSRKALKAGVEGSTGKTVGTTKRFDYNAFHVPTCKLVTKSYARLLYNDFRQDQSLFPDVDPSLATIPYEDSLTDKLVEKTFVNLAKQLTKERVSPSLTVPTNTGNLYTGSLWASFSSLLYYVGAESLQNKRVGLFSYGSGLAATMMSVVIKGDVSRINKILNFEERLAARTTVTPQQYEAAIALREALYGQKDYTPTGSIEHIAPGTYYLTNINDKFQRSYAIKE